MRRSAAVYLDLEDVDFKKKALSVLEKGGLVHRYQISGEGLQAIKDYIENERKEDGKAWGSPALFLPASTVTQSDFDTLNWPTSILRFGPPEKSPTGYPMSGNDTPDKEKP